MLPRSRSYVDTERILKCLGSRDSGDENCINAFEDRFRQYFEAQQCYATNQGRAALLIALKALALREGDEVIVQSFTYEGVIDAIVEAGGTPVFADNAIEDFNSGWKEISRKISGRTKVIIATHLFGVPCDIDEIMFHASGQGITVIEDCAQCLGALYNGQKTGTFGDMAFLSFNFEKHLSTGEGGMLIINNGDLLEPVASVVAQYRRMPLYEEKCYVYGLIIQYIATNSDIYWEDLSAYFGQDSCRKNDKLFQKLDRLIRKGATVSEIEKAVSPFFRKEMMKSRVKSAAKKHDALKNTASRLLSIRNNKKTDAAPSKKKIDNEYLLMNSLRAMVGYIGLDTLDEVNRSRNRHARTLYEQLRENAGFILPEISPDKKPVFLKYCILNVNGHSRADIFSRAWDEGFELGNAQWSKPVHATEPYQTNIAHDKDDLKTSEFLADHIINIPVHYYVNEVDLTRISSFLQEFRHIDD